MVGVTSCGNDSCSIGATGSIPGASTPWNRKPFDKHVEGLSHLWAKIYVIDSAVQTDDFQYPPLCCVIDGSPRGLRRYAGECNAAQKNIRKRASPRGARNNTTLPEGSARENLEKESSQGITPHVLADMETHEIGVF